MENNLVTAEIHEIAARIKELREVCEVSAEELAGKLGISVDKYMKYENAETDIPVGVIYAVSKILGVDSTTLLTGDVARMADYTVVRKGHAVKIDRYPGYSIYSLAINYIGREMSPMIVDMKREDNPEPVTHGGQEFNFVLKGTIVVKVGNRELTLNEGDCIYFNPRLPHSQRSVTESAEFMTVINE